MNKVNKGCGWGKEYDTLQPCFEQPISGPQKVMLQPTREEVLTMQLMETEEKLQRLYKAVEGVYFAAYWSPDRICEANKLWEELRKAAEIEPDLKKFLLSEGEPRPIDIYIEIAAR